jgi:hypothetical protein
MHQLSQYWRDAVVVMALAAAAGFASYRSAQFLDPAIYNLYDQWFESGPVTLTLREDVISPYRTGKCCMAASYSATTSDNKAR